MYIKVPQMGFDLMSIPAMSDKPEREFSRAWSLEQRNRTWYGWNRWYKIFLQGQDYYNEFNMIMFYVH